MKEVRNNSRCTNSSCNINSSRCTWSSSRLIMKCNNSLTWPTGLMFHKWTSMHKPLWEVSNHCNPKNKKEGEAMRRRRKVLLQDRRNNNEVKIRTKKNFASAEIIDYDLFWATLFLVLPIACFPGWFSYIGIILVHTKLYLFGGTLQSECCSFNSLPCIEF